MPAWWSANLADFLVREPEQIVGGLATRLVEAHSSNRDTQVRAWRAQIELLRGAVLLTGHAVLVLASRQDVIHQH
jgi:hypothetical protein